MRLSLILFFLGSLLASLAAFMLAPLLTALIAGEGTAIFAFLSSLLICAFAAGLMLFAGRKSGGRLNRADLCLFGFLGWAVAGAFAALPLMMILDFSIAKNYFLAQSALTTTGASIFSDVSTIDYSVKLWLALLQWLGGGFTILTAMMVLAPLDIGGMQLRQVVGISSETNLRQNVIKGLKIIVPFYGAFTFLCFLLLLPQVPFFDALCFALTTLSTGGMHLANDGSLLALPYVKFVLAIFMLIGAMNMSHYYFIWRGRYKFNHDLERKAFLILVGVIAISLAGFLLEERGVAEEEVRSLFAGGWGEVLLDQRWRNALGEGMFAAISVISTTNFHPPELELPFILTLLLTFIGGMTLSTAGGVKMMRFLLLLKQGRKELSLLAYPHDVKGVSFEGTPVHIDLMQTVWVFFALFNAAIAVLMLVFAFTGLSFEHSLAAALAAVANAGPMLDMVGIESTRLYANLPDSASWAMSLGMIGGRIELLALLSILSPIYWKR